jgi:hypothetical protein
VRRFLPPFPDQLVGQRGALGSVFRDQLLTAPYGGMQGAHAQLAVGDVQNDALPGCSPSSWRSLAKITIRPPAATLA